MKNVKVEDDHLSETIYVDSLSKDESKEITYTYTVKEQDVLKSKIVNIVKANAEVIYTDVAPPEEVSAQVTVTTVEKNGKLTITKVTTSKTPEGGYKLGDTITYKITVTNDGNLTITNITVKDELTGGEWTIDSLAPGKSREFTTSYIVTEDDIVAGSVKNIATATGTSPDPEKPDVPVDPGEIEDPTEEPNGHLTITKVTTSTMPEGGYKLGDTITYKITVTNDGNLTITNTKVKDELTEDELNIDTLAPEATKTFTVEYVVTETDVRAGKVLNVATAQGISPDPDRPDVPVTPGETEDKILNQYTITFVDEDGTVLQSGKVPYGETPSYTGKTPTKAADAQYTYTFDGWTPEITKVTGDATYTAKYSRTVNQYTITFVNEDGTVLQSGKVPYGETPSYTGKTPYKEPDDNYHWNFVGWDSETKVVTGDSIYTAKYEREEHKFTWVTTLEPTCTEPGEKQGTCDECHEVKTETIPALGHDWERVEVPPTCGEDGYIKYICRRDPSHMYIEKVIPAKAKQGIEVDYGDFVNYVHDNGATCAFVHGNGMTWLKEDSEGLSTWYGLDNSTGRFDDNSIFWVRWLNKDADAEEWDKYYGQLDEEHKKLAENDNLWIFLVGVTKSNCDEYHGTFDPPVDLYIQLGTDWNEDEVRAVFISDDMDEKLSVEIIENYKLPDGTFATVAKVKIRHFSPYAVYDDSDEPEPGPDIKPDDHSKSDSGKSESKSEIVKTADSLTTQGVFGLELLMMLSILGLWFSRRKKNNIS